MAREGGEELRRRQDVRGRFSLDLSAGAALGRPRARDRALKPGSQARGVTAMRVMVIVKANPESEAGALPSPELIEKMGAYNNDLIAAGVMLDGGGLQSSAKGARVHIQRGQAMVTDGPFAETKELIGGYWIWQVKSLEDAIAWAKKAPTDGDRPFELELRPVFEPEDFAGVASQEIIAQEQDWRTEQAKHAPKATA